MFYDLSDDDLEMMLAVEWAADVGLVNGYPVDDDGRRMFRPYAPMTRGQLVVVLDRFYRQVMGVRR